MREEEEVGEREDDEAVAEELWVMRTFEGDGADGMRDDENKLRLKKTKTTWCDVIIILKYTCTFKVTDQLHFCEMLLPPEVLLHVRSHRCQAVVQIHNRVHKRVDGSEDDA